MEPFTLAHRIKRQLGRELWIRPAAASLASVLMAAAAYWFGQRFDATFTLDIEKNSLVTMLSIFASSMLTVATFTVSAIVTAASSAASNTTPRAAILILADNRAQIVLSAFVAAFIYSIIAIFALHAFAYGSSGRFLLFAGMIVIFGFVLVSFINWVDHAMKLGRQGHTIDRLSEEALGSISPASVGTWGARICEDGDVPQAALGVVAREVGYVTGIDVARLQCIAEELDATIYVAARPGDFVDTTSPVLYVAPASERVRECLAEIVRAVETDIRREYGCDVRYGLINLAETADRALSPAVNDPGTAIAVLHRQLGVFTRWAECAADEASREVRHDRVFMPPLKPFDLVRDAFTPIARDGAGSVEVGIRLQKTMAALVRLGDGAMRDAVGEMSAIALALAERALVAEQHKEQVRSAAAGVRDAVGRAAGVRDADGRDTVPRQFGP